MAPEHRLRARACAKINLGLKIVRHRDDGFHELRTVFQTVALADRLELVHRAGRVLDVELRVRGDAPAGEGNIAHRALRLAADAFHLRGQFSLELDKRIPIGAGLGGGSSDAAAVIRLLAHISGPKAAPLHRQLQLAAELGSDVAPFLLGGSVLGLGRGEEVYSLPDLAPWHAVIAMPAGHTVSTPNAFADWDRRQLTAAGGSGTIIEFCSLLEQVLPAFRPLFHKGRNRGAHIRASKVQAGLENDFEAGVLSLAPDFPRIHQQLKQAGAAWVSLSGSGSAQFGLFAEIESAQRVAALLARKHRVWRTRLVSRAEYRRRWGVVQW
ncbi:MAG: 4-(cytidine 5'-diphospho)-2-C-methyl-D-erythritol kinase [Terriglobales bacterium]